MEDDPEEFVNLAIDTVDKQSNEILKSAAARVLEMLSDHIDGCTSFASHLSIMMINYCVACI